MTVTKVVVIVLSIPEQIILCFSDFSTILYVFTSLQLLILVFMYIFHLGPWIFVSSPQESLAELTEQSREGRSVSRRGESPVARGK